MTTVTAPEVNTPLTAEHRRVLAGSMVGTTIEWFDFFIYAQAAGLIFAAQYFNPASNSSPALAQIVSWASIGISFLFRPLGAIVAGHLGDRFGRKLVLVLTLFGMGGATVTMGLLPNYAAIGISAPLILVLLRIIQGLSAGGEWGGAALLAVEHAPVNRRSYFGSYPQIGVPAGMFLATVFMLALTRLTTDEQFNAWGWRIPFLSSLILIAVGYFIRKMVEESPVFAELQNLQKESTAPLGVLFKNHTKDVFIAAFIFAGCNAAGYLAIAFFNSYGTKVLLLPKSQVLLVSLLGSVTWLIGTIWSGLLGDKLGKVNLRLGLHRHDRVRHPDVAAHRYPQHRFVCYRLVDPGPVARCNVRPAVCAVCGNVPSANPAVWRLDFLRHRLHLWRRLRPNDRADAAEQDGILPGDRWLHRPDLADFSRGGAYGSEGN